MQNRKTKVLDWYIEIKQGNHAQYKVLFEIQDCDLNLCVAYMPIMQKTNKKEETND